MQSTTSPAATAPLHTPLLPAAANSNSPRTVPPDRSRGYPAHPHPQPPSTSHTPVPTPPARSTNEHSKEYPRARETEERSKYTRPSETDCSPRAHSIPASRP